MKKLSKRLLAVVLSVAVLASLGLFVAAAQGNEPTIIFDAATKTFSFQNTSLTDGRYPDLFSKMKNLMPGDRVSQEIKVKVKTPAPTPSS